MIKDEELIHKAKQLINPRKLSKSVDVGHVASALITDKGNIYVGVCLDVACGIGFCAETNAIANMITHNESRIICIVAVDRNGQIISPCGRCRELIYQINPQNSDTRVLLRDIKSAMLKELLPNHWYMD